MADGHIPAATARGGSNDVLVERKGNEKDKDQKIDYGTDAAHCLGTAREGAVSDDEAIEEAGYLAGH